MTETPPPRAEASEYHPSFRSLRNPQDPQAMPNNHQSYRPKTSLFNAFGRNLDKRHNSFRSGRQGGLEQAGSSHSTVAAREGSLEDVAAWRRRPSLRLPRFGRAAVESKTSSGLQDYNLECEATDEELRPSKLNRWFRSLSCRRSKHYAGPQLYKSITYSSEHVASSLDTSAIVDEEDYARDANLNGGAAARAAAAAQNEQMESIRQLLPREMHRLRDLKLTNDSESGIGIEVRDQSDELEGTEALMVRRDPATTLPVEIFTQILLSLDAQSLIRAEMVSARWNATATSGHLWRSIFTSEYGRAPLRGSNASPSQVGGLGFGSCRPDQQWKRMWKARKALQARWESGHAAAVYLEGHQDTVYCVQFDEQKILTGSRDRTIRIWDANTFECLRILGVPKQLTTSQMSTIPLNRPNKGHQPFEIITASVHSRSLRVPTAEETPMYHHGSVLCLQFDDNMMITGSSDTTLIIWDIQADWKPKHRLRQHRAGVLDVCFDTEYIVSCSKDTTICLWDRSTGALLRVLAGHRGPVNAVQLRGELIVSASGDGVAKLWNISSGLCVKEFPSRDRGLACVEFSPDCRMIFAGGNDQLIYQFDATNGELIRDLKGHIHLVRSLHLDYLNGRIVSGSYDRSIKVYNIDTGEMMCDFAGWTASWMLSAKADYRRIVATSQDKRVVVMDFGHGLPGVELLRSL